MDDLAVRRACIADTGSAGDRIRSRASSIFKVRSWQRLACEVAWRRTFGPVDRCTICCKSIANAGPALGRMWSGSSGIIEAGRRAGERGRSHGRSRMTCLSASCRQDKRNHSQSIHRHSSYAIIPEPISSRRAPTAITIAGPTGAVTWAGVKITPGGRDAGVTEGSLHHMHAYPRVRRVSTARWRATMSTPRSAIAHSAYNHVIFDAASRMRGSKEFSTAIRHVALATCWHATHSLQVARTVRLSPPVPGRRWVWKYSRPCQPPNISRGLLPWPRRS